jgi:predicted nuclease of predicted toxin-antitoxin system
LLFDQNISHKILKLLPELYIESSSVKQENLINATDKQIWKYAKRNGFTIFTQDSDFNDLNILYGFPPKIIWLRTGNLNTKSIVRVLIDNQDEISNFSINEEFGCFQIKSIS